MADLCRGHGTHIAIVNSADRIVIEDGLDKLARQPARTVDGIRRWLEVR